jgi:hypothetical protein
MRIPATLLERPDIKWTLNGSLLAPEAAVKNRFGWKNARAEYN